MIYNSNSLIDVQNSKQRLDYLLKKGCIFELTEKKPKRTYKQNKYLHLILSWFGLELGYTLEESKEIYKRLNKETYNYIKNNLTFVRSSASLDSKELSLTIEKFRNYSSQKANVYLPEAKEVNYLNEIEIKIKNNKYL